MEQFLTKKRNLYVLLWILIFLGLILTGRHDYLIFHSLAETFSIVIACGIFMIAWNSRRFLDNNYLLFIGIAFLFIGALDFVHMLAYKGMGVFSGGGGNLSTQLWIASRYMESLSLFLAPLFFRRKLRVNTIFLGYTLSIFLLLMSIFYWKVFPVCFVEGIGVTPFKKISEYIISLILLGSIILIFKYRKEFVREVLQWVVGSMAIMIVSELNFTSYTDLYGASNFIGHLFKILAFYFIYKALIETGIRKPYDLLARDIKNKEILLREEKNRIQKYLDIAGVIFVVIGKDQKVSLINKKGCETLGYNENEIIGKNWFDTFVPEGERTGVKETFTKLISGEPNPVEYSENSILTKTGEEKIVAWYNALLKDDKGNTTGTISSGEDITENKKAEETLRKNKERFEILSETASRLLTADKPQEIVNELCQKVMLHLDCHAFFNYLADEEKGRLHLNAYAGIPEETGKEIEWLNYGTAVCGCVARDACRIVSEDIPNMPDPRTELVKSFGIKAYACHPLFSAGRVIGTLSFGTRTRATFTEDELSLMKTVADQVAVAMERISLIEALRKSRDELEIRVQERTSGLAALNEELLTEVSERKRIEKVLIEQSSILEGFFTSTITPLVLLDRNFNFVRVNEAYAQACKRNVSDFSGHNHFELYPHEENEAIFRQVVETKTPFQTFARPFSFPDHPEWGVTYWNWTLTPILDPAGKVEFLVFSLADVTERKRTELELKTAHQYTRSLLEASIDPFVTINAEGKITDVNTATEMATGVPREQLIGSDFSEYFTDPERAREGYKTVFRQGSVRDYPLSIRDNSGMITDVLYNATIFRNDAGEIQGVFAAARDISRQKEAENRIQSTNALLHLFAKKASRKEYIEAVVDLIQSWTGCRYVGLRVLNNRDLIPYESYRGFSKGFWESENFLSIKNDQCACIRVITGNPDAQDLPIITPGGSFHCENTFSFIGQLSEEEKARFRGICVENGFLSISIIPVRYQEKVIGAIHLADEREGKIPLKMMEFIESVTPIIGEAIIRFDLEEELRDSENRLRTLSSQLLTVQENERKRVAVDLHDSIGQMLTAVKFKAEEALHKIPKGKSKEPLELVVSMIKQTIEEVRRLQMDLHPSTLDDIGILATLEWFCREYQKIYSHIRIEKEIGLHESDAPLPLRTVIYRVAQEALNNIAKHSLANRVHLLLKREENRIEMVIRDNGRGFNIEETFSSNRSEKGMGLNSMRERVEFSGGSFVIETSPGEGTIIKARWNIN